MTEKASLAAPVPLSAVHGCEDFDCGDPVLDEWLRRYALQNQRANASKTFVACQGTRVVGYYSLAVGAVEYAAASERVRKGLARHPVPVMILARLAVDAAHQGKKIGRSLLKDAVVRILNAADYAGIRAILVHAKNDRAKSFYTKFGFEPSPLSSLQLMLLLKDAAKALRQELSSPQ